MSAAQPAIVIVLAAGSGTRMGNALPKVLHPLAGRTLIGHVLAVAAELAPERVTVVVARGAAAVEAEVRARYPDATIAVQDTPRGTGHAVAAARESLPSAGTALVLYGDTPLLEAATLAKLVAARESAGAAVAVLGMRAPDPTGYGRLAFDGDALVAIVEERDADAGLKGQTFCNSGVMALDLERLPAMLAEIEPRPGVGEIYLTDVVARARAQGWSTVAVEGPWEDSVGVNSQTQLAEVAALLQRRLRRRALDGGVVMEAPGTVELAADVRLAPGAIIEPYVVLGPGVRVAEGATVRSFSHLEGAMIGERAVVGPFARLRAGTVVEAGARVGNFVEMKAARLGPGAKANHLTYLGDADVGTGANIGAGTITCNYDGFGKHRTEIGAGAFIGSNTALVAPVRIGAGAFVGAGSTITRSVPDDALAIARGPQDVRVGGAPRLRDRLRRRKEG